MAGQKGAVKNMTHCGYLSRHRVPRVLFELFDAPFFGFEQPQPLLCLRQSRLAFGGSDGHFVGLGTPVG